MPLSMSLKERPEFARTFYFLKPEGSETLRFLSLPTHSSLMLKTIEHTEARLPQPPLPSKETK
jgi:hypothetical protein